MNYHEISADIRKRGVRIECKVAPKLLTFSVVNEATNKVCGHIVTFSHGAACEIAKRDYGRRWFLKYRLVSLGC